MFNGPRNFEIAFSTIATNTKYHQLGLHFIATYSYIQIVLNYSESDEDLYDNHYLANFRILPAFQPGHYYFHTDLLSYSLAKRRRWNDTFLSKPSRKPSTSRRVLTAQNKRALTYSDG